MNIEEKSKFVTELESYLQEKLKQKNYHAIIAVEKEGEGFSFYSTTLNKKSAFESCDLIVNGIFEESESLVSKFKLPSDRRFKKPIEPK